MHTAFLIWVVLSQVYILYCVHKTKTHLHHLGKYLNSHLNMIDVRDCKNTDTLKVIALHVHDIHKRLGPK